jgi:hypothetical protein
VSAPFALDFFDGDKGLGIFYLFAGVAVLAVSLVTNYQYSPKREWTPSMRAAAARA